MRPGSGPFGRPGAAVLNKKVRRRRGKVLPAFSKAAGCGGRYVPVGRCPAADRAGRRDWRPTVFQPAQPVKKAAAQPHAAKRIGRAANLSHKTKKGTQGKSLDALFICLWERTGANPYRSFGERAVFAPGPFSPAAPPSKVARLCLALCQLSFEKAGQRTSPASGAFFYYLHSLYTFAPWAGNVAASFPSTVPWSWWLHSSRAV